MKNVKKKNVHLYQLLCLGILCCFCFTPCFIKAQNNIWCYQSYYDGYWAKFEYQNPRSSSYKIIMNSNSFTIYKDSYHPSNFFLKINLPTNFPSYQNYQKHKKNMNIKIIDMYDGTVEYYVREDYQTIKEVLKKFNRPEFNKDDGKPGLPVAKRIEKCRISCYKGKWDIKFLDFSIWFDKETVWRFCVAY